MTNKLQVSEPFDKSRLDPAHYFQSLLTKAAAKGLLQNTEEIRSEVLQLAAKTAQRYTFGASSSVTIETAQGLLESVMCCIGRRLKEIGIGEALNELKVKRLEEICTEGKKLLRDDLDKARQLFEYLQQHALATENAAYKGTLNEAIPSFFASYDVYYAAHDIPCLIDYPLSVETPNLLGVEYILEYLKRLRLENDFCCKYSDQIEELLLGYSPHANDLNINIFELVLTNLTGQVLLGKDTSELDISESDRDGLQETLYSAQAQRLKIIVSMAAQRICADFKLPPQIQRYVNIAAGHIVPRLRNALETGTLGYLFVTLKHKTSSPAYFEDSVSMEDEKFRTVTEEIRSCRHISDKLMLIKQHIKSITDLADMLSASCLYGSEYEALYNTLDNITLALLYKRLPEEDSMYITEGEHEWQSAYIEFLNKSGKAENVIIESNQVELE